MTTAKKLLTAIFALGVVFSTPSHAVALGSYNVDITKTTVSGLSSGGFMAVDMGIAYSATVKGVGVFAGGPYWCAKGSISNATSICMAATQASIGPVASDYVTKINNNSSAGTIDNKSNMANQKWWLITGASDTTVYPYVMDALNTMLGSFTSNITYVNRKSGMAHTLPTLWTGGSACGSTASPYVGNCSYDGA